MFFFKSNRLLYFPLSLASLSFTTAFTSQTLRTLANPLVTMPQIETQLTLQLKAMNILMVHSGSSREAKSKFTNGGIAKLIKMMRKFKPTDIVHKSLYKLLIDIIMARTDAAIRSYAHYSRQYAASRETFLPIFIPFRVCQDNMVELNRNHRKMCDIVFREFPQIRNGAVTDIRSCLPTDVSA